MVFKLSRSLLKDTKLFLRRMNIYDTGKWVSDVLILESVNPQYDESLFIEFPEKNKFRTCFVQILFWMSKQKQNKNNFCTQHVLNSYFLGEFNEQSLFKLWVNWCKNEGFWKRFPCTLWNSSWNYKSEFQFQMASVISKDV